MVKLFQKTNSLIYVCRTTPELYSYLLWQFNTYLQKAPLRQKIKIENAILKIKIWIMNHQILDKIEVKQLIFGIKNALEKEAFEQLNATLKASCEEPISAETRWENVFYRNFESHLAVIFLSNPTQKMLTAVRLVSEKIIVILIKNKHKNHDIIQKFLTKISLDSKEPEAFSKIDIYPLSLETIIKILLENNLYDFPKILLIHYSFARHLYRELEDVSAPNDPIILDGTFCHYLKENGHTHEELKNPSPTLRKNFIDNKLRGAHFFKDWRLTRGRANFNDNIFSTRMGILLARQPEDNLPCLLAEGQKWSPDALCQEPAFDSPHVQKVLKQDLVYVAGPSGMTTLLLGQAELLACFPSTELKEAYTLCCAAFIVSGGLHSWHEVVYIAHDLLNYFQNYQLGHYQHLFDRFNGDIQCGKNLAKTWCNFLLFCDKTFKKTKLQNELNIRRKEYFESKLALTACFKTKKYQGVTLTSKAICKEIEKDKVEVFFILLGNKTIKKELYHPDFFGSLSSSKEDEWEIVHDILNVLKNDNSKLEEIIHLHSIFFRYIYNELTENKLLNKKITGLKKDADRGRVVKNFNPQPSTRLGISRHSFFNAKIGRTQRAHLCGLEEYEPDLRSKFYLTMAKKSVPFVSGLSGHTAKLLSGAKALLPLHEGLIKEYSFACFAYLCKGGNHSFHEVMAVADSANEIRYQTGNYYSGLPASFMESPEGQTLQKEWPEYFINCEDDTDIGLHTKTKTATFRT